MEANRIAVRIPSLTHAFRFMTRPSPDGAVCVGTFPPPVHGVSVSLSRIADDIARCGSVKRITISPGQRTGVFYHATKAFRVVVAMVRMAYYRAGSMQRLYTPADAGWGGIYTCAIVAMARVLGYRVIIHHHSFAYLLQRSALINALAKLGGGETTHVMLCQCMKEKFCRLYPHARNLLVVSNAAHVEVDPPVERSVKKGGPGIRIGHLSNLTYEKGFAEVVEVFEELMARGVDVTLVLAGPTEVKEIRDRIEGLRARFPLNFAYLGKVLGEEKKMFFESIDTFVFPTRYRNEAQPYVLIEAIAQGVPCIALRRGCIAETLEGVGNCIVEKPEDFVEAASGRIWQWATDPVQRQLDSNAVRASAARQFAEAQREYSCLISLLLGRNEPE